MTDARPAIYARISEDRSGEALGVTDQLKDARAIAAQRGWPIAGEYRDNDLSALKGSRRDGYEALMSAVDAGQVTHIIVWHTSRLWRNRRERAEGIERLKAARVSVVAVKGPELDMSTAYGRGVAGLVGEFDTMESEVKSERVARAAKRRAEAGMPHGGRRCFGYSKSGLETVPAEADEVAKAVRDLLQGVPLGAVVRDMQRRDVKTVGGKQWSSLVLRELLVSPRLAGLSVHRGLVVGKGQWPPIITEDEHHAVVALLTDPSRRTSPGNQPAYLLSGIATCEKCGGSIASFGLKKRLAKTGEVTKRFLYRCRTGACVARRRDWCDDFVRDVVLERLSRDDARDLLVDDEGPDAAAAHREAAALRLRLEGLGTAFADDDEGDPIEFRAASKRLRERITALEAVTASVSRAPILRDLIEANNIRAVWEAIGLERQRAVIRCLFAGIVMVPGGGGKRTFDPTKVQLTWNEFAR